MSNRILRFIKNEKLKGVELYDVFDSKHNHYGYIKRVASIKKDVWYFHYPNCKLGFLKLNLSELEQINSFIVRLSDYDDLRNKK